MPGQGTPQNPEQGIQISLCSVVQTAEDCNRLVLLCVDMKTRRATMGKCFRILRGEVGGATEKVRAGSRWQKVMSRTREWFLNLKTIGILGHLTLSTTLSLFSPNSRNNSLLPGHSNQRNSPDITSIPWRAKLCPLGINGLKCQLQWGQECRLWAYFKDRVDGICWQEQM